MPSVAVNSAHERVAACVLRRVKSGCEQDFEDALHHFVEQTLELPGQDGVHIVRPASGSGSREYGILRKFTDEVARDSFYASEAFREWEKRIEPWVEGAPEIRWISGLETWFTPLGQRTMTPPARWKMALVTYLGVSLTTIPLAWFVMPSLQAHGSFLSSNLIFNILVVIALTWGVMPLLIRLFKNLLHPDAVS